jgi:hypothetical protein
MIVPESESRCSAECSQQTFTVANVLFAPRIRSMLSRSALVSPALLGTTDKPRARRAATVALTRSTRCRTTIKSDGAARRNVQSGEGRVLRFKAPISEPPHVQTTGGIHRLRSNIYSANNSSSDQAPTRTPSTRHDRHTGNTHMAGNMHTGSNTHNSRRSAQDWHREWPR